MKNSSQGSPSLSRRRWISFTANKRGYYSLIIFLIFFLLSLFAEVISNDKPLFIRYQGAWYFPLMHTYNETVFGGDFETEADYRESSKKEYQEWLEKKIDEKGLLNPNIKKKTFLLKPRLQYHLSQRRK